MSDPEALWTARDTDRVSHPQCLAVASNVDVPLVQVCKRHPELVLNLLTRVATLDGVVPFAARGAAGTSGCCAGDRSSA